MINSTITPEPTLTGIRFGNRIIGYSTAVRQIDNGNYDKRIPDGLDLIACIMEGIESGWFMPCIEKQIILWPPSRDSSRQRRLTLRLRFPEPCIRQG